MIWKLHQKGALKISEQIQGVRVNRFERHCQKYDIGYLSDSAASIFDCYSRSKCYLISAIRRFYPVTI